MWLPEFEVDQPATVDEACALLKKHAKEGAAALAGGTDLLVNIRIPVIPVHLTRGGGPAPRSRLPSRLIALSRIPELRGVAESGDGKIVIGATTTITEVCRSSLVRDRLRALAEAGDDLGSPLVRNRGTVGGNICNARPAADMLVASAALGCQLELKSRRGVRTMPVEEFVTGPGKTVRKRDEILTKLVYPVPGGAWGSSTIKLANRKALEIAVVNVSSRLALDPSGKISAARIAMGAVGPTPILAEKAAEFLSGKEPSDENFRKAGEIASGECRPIDDHRGGADYRRESVQVLVRRTLGRALESARRKK